MTVKVGDFKVGETVVYPHHGAALIEAIETRTIKGEDRTYLVLKVAQGDLTVRVPADNVDLVGILDADGLLHFAEFRVNERAFQLMEQVSGRAGRKEATGKVSWKQEYDCPYAISYPAGPRAVPHQPD